MFERNGSGLRQPVKPEDRWEKNMTLIPKANEIYRHFKGNLYRVVTVAEHSETGQQLVIYQALYGEGKTYARPLDAFVSKVDRNKYPDASQEYRFERQELVPADRTAGTPATDRTDEPQESAGTEEAQQNSAQSAEEEWNIDPMVMEFLDARTYEEKLNLLMGMKARITDEMINTLAVASDVEIADGSLEERFAQLRNCLLTKDKYECSRLR